MHSPVNGSEARKGEPDAEFGFTIAKRGERGVGAGEFLGVAEPEVERWDFSWFEGEFA